MAHVVNLANVNPQVFFGFDWAQSINTHECDVCRANVLDRDGKLVTCEEKQLWSSVGDETKAVTSECPEWAETLSGTAHATDNMLLLVGVVKKK